MLNEVIGDAPEPIVYSQLWTYVFSSVISWGKMILIVL